MKYQQLPYWVLAEAERALNEKSASLTLRKHPAYSPKWLARVKDSTIDEALTQGFQCCGDDFARVETVKKFVQRALYEQDDELKKQMSGGGQ